jgi:hypothetical protein
LVGRRPVVHSENVLLNALHLELSAVNKDGAAVGTHVLGKLETWRVRFGHKMADKAGQAQGLGKKGELIYLNRERTLILKAANF